MNPSGGKVVQERDSKAQAASWMVSERVTLLSIPSDWIAIFSP